MSIASGPQATELVVGMAVPTCMELLGAHSNGSHRWSDMASPHTAELVLEYTVQSKGYGMHSTHS